MAGIFQNGVWSCGFDFLPQSTITAGGVFDIGGVGSGLPTVGSAYARLGIGFGCLVGSNQGYFGRSFNVNLQTFYHGLGFFLSALPTPGTSNSGIQGLINFYDATAGAPQFFLCYTATGQMGFYSVGSLGPGGATPFSGLLGPLSNQVLVPNAYYFLEMLLTVSAGGGVLQLRINGTTVLTFNGPTQTTANAFINRIYWGNAFAGSNSSSNHQFDDFYLLDTTGPSPLNAFLGVGRIQTDGPTADSATGGLNTWTATNPLGTDHQNFAQIPANTSDYNFSNTVGARASCKFPTLSSSRVFFFNCWDSDELDASGTRTIATVYRNNAIDQVGPTISPTNGSYIYHNTTSVIDPNTSAPWAVGAVSNTNNMEIGPQVIS